MAESPAHKFGQVIGNMIEDLVMPLLQDFADRNGLYLDFQKNPRKARKGKKVKWQDSYGNSHDLDYIIERDGTDEEIGTPVAFIEVAWRRYTKHSRNKAQEIQGAVLPLAEKHKWCNPFLGAVLAGFFTQGSLEQLRSMGFNLLYFPYDKIVQAFTAQGIDIAFDESTPESNFKVYLLKIEQAPEKQLNMVKNQLCVTMKTDIDGFIEVLQDRIDRMVNKIIIIPLYGHLNEFTTISEALEFLDAYSVYEGSGVFRKYELLVTFTNGDRVEGSFKNHEKVRDFLQFISKQ